MAASVFATSVGQAGPPFPPRPPATPREAIVITEEGIDHAARKSAGNNSASALDGAGIDGSVGT